LTAIQAAQSQNNKEDEAQVFGANLGKNDQGMQIAEPAAPAGGPVKPAAQAPVQSSPVATTTPDQALLKTEEADKMFDEKNYDGSIDKLEQVNQLIDNGSGQVQGVSETASSTK